MTESTTTFTLQNESCPSSNENLESQLKETSSKLKSLLVDQEKKLYVIFIELNQFQNTESQMSKRKYEEIIKEDSQTREATADDEINSRL